MLIFQDRANTKALAIANGQQFPAGTVYGAKMPVWVGGGATVPDQFVVDSFVFNNGGTVSDNVTSSEEFRGSVLVAMSA